MKTLLERIANTAVFTVASLLAGCVAGGSALDQSAAGSFENIEIVAIEGPPLTGAGLSSVGLAGSEWIVGGTTLGSSSLLVVGGVMMMADLPQADQRSAVASRRIESFLDQEEMWEPTLEIAGEAKRQLAAGNDFSVHVASSVRRLPGVDERDATFMMENWMAPLRAWYNESPSTSDYADQLQSDAVLEVGLLNYELSTGSLLVQVVMKLVDPSTGAVLANARNYSNTKVEDVAGLFENEAGGFKRLFQSITADLVRECIADLGFL